MGVIGYRLGRLMIWQLAVLQAAVARAAVRAVVPRVVVAAEVVAVSLTMTTHMPYCRLDLADIMHSATVRC